jgi:hypothetical protein
MVIERDNDMENLLRYRPHEWLRQLGPDGLLLILALGLFALLVH